MVALLKAASDSTRARFKDIQFQRNKRRKDAQSSSTMLSRSWYLPVESWITGTTLVGATAEAAESEEQVGVAVRGLISARFGPPADIMAQCILGISGAPNPLYWSFTWYQHWCCQGLHNTAGGVNSINSACGSSK